MITFYEFLILESPMATLANILKLVDRPGTPQEGEAAKIAAARYITGKNLGHLTSGFDINKPSTFSIVYNLAARENPGSRQSWSSSGASSSYSRPSSPPPPPRSHPSDQFLIDIRKAALRHGFEDSNSSNYIIHIDIGYTGMIFTNKRFHGIQLMVPTQKHYSRDNSDFKPFWVLRHRDGGSNSPNIGRGDSVSEFETLINRVDLAKIDVEALAAKMERDRPKHSETTPEQKTIETILQAHHYTLIPPTSANQSQRYWNAPDRKGYIYVPSNGDWDAYITVAGKTKSATRGSKKRTPVDLEKYLSASVGKEATIHANPEMDKILKYLDKNGFKKKDMMYKTATQFFENRGEGIDVQVGRSSFMAKGRITKAETIAWKISTSFRFKVKTFETKTGSTFGEFQKAMDEIVKFENGPVAIDKVIDDYGFKPKPLSSVADHFRDASYEWVTCGTKILGKGTVCTYYLGYNPKTGHYIYVQSGLMSKDWKELEGVDIPTLKAQLAKDGFKPLHEGVIRKVHMKPFSQFLTEVEMVNMYVHDFTAFHVPFAAAGCDCLKPKL